MSRAAAGVATGAVLVLLTGVGVVALRAADREQAYDETAAVEAFRRESAAAVPSATARPSARPSAAAPGSPVQGAGASVPTAGASSLPSGTPAPPAAPGAPVPVAKREVESGVYRYATSGHEEVDVLGGSRHDYPASTTITYGRSGCGSEERWQPLEGRVGVTVLCDGGAGTELRSTYQEREFFGQSQSKAYRCDPGFVLHPRDPRPGQSWQGRCRSDDSTITLTGRVVALEELDVGGTAVPVVRVRVAGTLTGSTRGRSDREVWLARADGLLVQAIGDTDTDADTPGGTVRYREQYRLRLESQTPRR